MSERSDRAIGECIACGSEWRHGGKMDELYHTGFPLNFIFKSGRRDAYTERSVVTTKGCNDLREQIWTPFNELGQKLLLQGVQCRLRDALLARAVPELNRTDQPPLVEP